MYTQGMIPAKENASKKISDRYQKKVYVKGATCIYGDTLYRAKADITTAEEWNAAHWEKTNLETIRAEMAAELSSLNAKIVFKERAVTFSDGYTVVTMSELGFLKMPVGFMVQDVYYSNPECITYSVQLADERMIVYARNVSSGTSAVFNGDRRLLYLFLF